MRIFPTALVIAVLATPVHADLQEIASSLTLDQVVAEALHENPQLHSLRAKWEATQERPLQQQTLPDPQLTIKGGNAPGNFSFPRTQETSVELEQTFPWFGKLSLRGKVATKEAESVRREYETLARDVVLQVKEAYFDLYAVQQSLAINRSEEDVLTRMAQTAEARYATGQLPQQDVLKAQAELTMLKARRMELEQQESVLNARLNQLLNRPPESGLGLAVTGPPHDLKLKAADLSSLAGLHRPEINKARADIQRAEAERDLMKKESLPDYRLGLEYGHMDSGYTDFSGSENILMIKIGFDLPIWRTKYRAGVREAEKNIESSQAGFEAAVRQASFDVQEAWFKLQTAQRQLELYRKELLPEAEARLSASEAGYRTGKSDFLDVLESERFRLNARLLAAVAEGDFGTQLARLERAVGVDLTPAPANVEKP